MSEEKPRLPYHLIEISAEAVEKLVPGISWPWQTSANYFIGEDIQHYNCFIDEDFIIVVTSSKGSDKATRVFKYCHHMDTGW